MRVSPLEVLCYASSKKVLVENLRNFKSLFFKIFICFHNVIKLAQTTISDIENKETHLSLSKCAWVKDTMLKQQGNPEIALKIGNSQKGFTKGKLCLTSPNAFCGEMPGSVAKWRDQPSKVTLL